MTAVFAATFCPPAARSASTSWKPTLAASTQDNVLDFLESMREFFGERLLSDIDAGLVADYRNHRKAQPSRNNRSRKVKGATVNRELTYLRCILNFAVERKYISEDPARGVKLFDKRRERPVKRMLTLEGEQRILENAPPYLRVTIVLLAQTGGRTYTEGFSLRWDQIDFNHKVMFFGGDTKTEGSSEPVPLTGLAHDVLLIWKKEQAARAHSFSKSGRARPSDYFGEEGLENDA